MKISETDTQLINAVGQLNLFNELINSGYGNALNNLEDDYSKLLEQTIAEASRRGVTALSGAGLQGLETLKDCSRSGVNGIVLKSKQNIFLDKNKSINYVLLMSKKLIRKEKPYYKMLEKYKNKFSWLNIK